MAHKLLGKQLTYYDYRGNMLPAYVAQIDNSKGITIRLFTKPRWWREAESRMFDMRLIHGDVICVNFGRAADFPSIIKRKRELFDYICSEIESCGWISHKKIDSFLGEYWIKSNRGSRFESCAFMGG